SLKNRSGLVFVTAQVTQHFYEADPDSFVPRFGFVPARLRDRAADRSADTRTTKGRAVGEKKRCLRSRLGAITITALDRQTTINLKVPPEHSIGFNDEQFDDPPFDPTRRAVSNR
ncbi:MAG: hypothetical protein ABIU29_12740, partial [Chthoniobacterales bacterium]